MSDMWKCIDCGTVMMSKCPGQRNTFYGPEVTMIQSVVTVDRVDYHGTRIEGLSELFVSYTAGSDKTTAEQFRNLAEMLAKPGVLESMTCDHTWVMNSETETTCCLDHKHSNLTDVERIKADRKTAAKALSIQSTVKELANVACTPIELARKAVNCSKDKFESFIEEEFSQLKRFVRIAMEDQLANGKSFRAPYRVLTTGRYWESDARFAYFDRLEDAIDMARGSNKKLSIEELVTTSDRGYLPVEYDMTTTCIHCGKLNLPEGGIIVKLPEGEAHLTCVNKQKRDKEVKLRRIRFQVNKLIGMSYGELNRIREIFNLEHLDAYWDEENKRRTHVYVAATMNNADFINVVDKLKREVFI